MAEKQEKMQISDADQLYIEKFRLMDDDFMRLVFNGEKTATAELLKVILGRDDIVVVSVEVQKEYKSLQAKGRTIYMDIMAVDGEGKRYDIEIQRSDAGAAPERARYHISMLDSKALMEKQKFKDITQSYVIFITENDIYKAGLPMYHADRWIQELQIPHNDGAHIIYVNGAYRNNENPVGRLMHDFLCTNPDEMFSPVLAERVRYFKRDEGGRAEMCKMMEDMRKEAADATRTETRVEMLQTYMEGMKCDAETAMEFFKISVPERVILRPLLGAN